MDPNTYASSRLTALEIERAALRAERIRLATEQPERTVRGAGTNIRIGTGLLRRARRAIAARRAATAHRSHEAAGGALAQQRTSATGTEPVSCGPRPA